MHYRLKSLSLATATLLLSLTSPLDLIGITPEISKAVAQAKTTQDELAKAMPLKQERLQPFDTGQFQIAGSAQVEIRSKSSPAQLQEELERHQQALVRQRTKGDRTGEANTLNQIGAIYTRLGEYSKALDYHQQALAIYEQIQDRKGEAETLGHIGNTYFKAGQYRQVEDLFRQKLESLRTVGDKESEQLILEVMRRYLEREWGFQAGFGAAKGTDIFNRLGQGDISWQEQLEISQLNLFISLEIADRKAQQHSLHSIGWVYRNLGRYSQALESYQQSLAIARERNVKDHEVFLLIEIGLVYNDISQDNKALKLLEQALSMLPSLKESGELVVPFHYLEPFALNQIGLIYKKLKQYDRALVFFQQSLSKPSFEEQNILNNIGLVYFERGEYYQAIKSYQQALNHSSPNTGDPSVPGFILNSIGLVNTQLGDYAQALKAYQKALAIFKELNDHPGERTTLSNIGSLLEKQNQPELAIVFYKEAVNVTEAIRQGLRELTIQEQEAYTKTIASTYRSLADLLLKKDRVLEAQKVLDLLKVQELDDYLRNVRGNNQTATGLPNLPPEEQFNQAYEALINKAITLGKELTQLEKIPEQNRTPAQQQRVIELRNTQQKILAEFNSFIHSPAVETIVQQLSQTAKRQNLDLEDLNSLQSNLKKLNQNAVLLYPLILDDRLELVLVTADSPPIHRAVPVKREELNRVIAQFRTALENPSSDAKTPAHQLYDWLIKPIENDLTQANAQTIIYAPDAQLRYIPLAALHDGKQWLVQRFRVNNITARSLKEIDTQPQVKPHVLAGAFTKGSYRFKLRNQEFSFNGLPFAAREVENLAATVPGTTQLLDQAFSRDETVPRMNDYNIIHLATHAVFVTGQPEDSFVLFGNGDRVTLRDIDNWSLPNVDLVVLSACETGLGGFGNGQEILGFGYLMQKTGARTAIASLWSVSDGGTQALMDAFYTALENSNTTKAEALRQAQIALITGDYTALGKQRGLGVQQRLSNSLPSKVANHLSHPYYWAPFILIGNGL